MDGLTRFAIAKRRKSCVSLFSERVAVSSVRVTVFAVVFLVIVLMPTVPVPGPLMSLFWSFTNGLFVVEVAAQQSPKSELDGKVMTIVPSAGMRVAIGSSI